MGEGGGFPRVRAMVSFGSQELHVARPNTKGVPECELDALPSPGVNPLEGSPKCSYEKLGLGRRSRLLAL